MPTHRLIRRLRLPMIAAMVVFVNAHHILMRRAEVEWRLSTMVLVYGVLGPAAAWVILGWLARISERAEGASEARERAAEQLHRRNEQLEALHEAARLLAGTPRIDAILDSLAEAARRASGARGAALVWLGAEATSAGHSGVPASGIDHTVARSCRDCPTLALCPLPDDVRCLALRSGSTRLGYLRLVEPLDDPLARRGIETLAADIELTWSARNAEARTLAALQRVERQAAADGSGTDTPPDLLEALGSALGAREVRFLPAPGEPFPRPHGSDGGGAELLWSDDGRQVTVDTPTGGRLELTFDGPRLPRALDPRFLTFLASHAALLHDARRGVARAVWDERRRLAAEIHDGLAQTLAYLHLQLARVAAALPASADEGSAGRVRDLAETTLAAYEAVRAVIDDLRISPGPDESVESLLCRVAATTATAGGIGVTVHLPADAHLSPVAAAQLARVVQEAIANAASHGLARNVAITGEVHGAALRVEIADDGVGFVVEAVGSAGHHGIAMMRERVASVGGSFSLTSERGAGTTVGLELPLETAQGMAAPVSAP